MCAELKQKEFRSMNYNSYIDTESVLVSFPKNDLKILNRIIHYFLKLSNYLAIYPASLKLFFYVVFKSILSTLRIKFSFCFI